MKARSRSSRARDVLVTDGAPVERVRASLVRILEESPLCAMATMGPRGRPHVHTAYYAFSRDFTLVFLSDAQSVHASNLRMNPSAAVAVFRSPQEWGQDDRGVQLFGECSEARGAARARAARIYASRFPRYDLWVAGSGVAASQADQLRSYRFFRFMPRRFKILDESEFGGAVFIEGQFRRDR